MDILIWYKLIKSHLSDIRHKVDCLLSYICACTSEVPISANNIAAIEGETLLITGSTEVDSLPNFQWQQFVGGAWTNVPGQTGAELTRPAILSGSYTYRLVASNDTCNVYSDAITVTATCPQVSIAASGPTTYCFNSQSVTLISQVTGGTGMNTYQWQSLSGAVWSDVAGQTGANYVLGVGALAVGTHEFRVNFTQDTGCTSTSNSIIITIITGAACLGNITGTVKNELGAGVGSVTIRLLPDNNADGIADNNTSVASHNTVSSGNYSFANVAPGNYVLQLVMPGGYHSISESDVTPDGDVAPDISGSDAIIPITIHPGVTDGGNNFVISNV